MEKSKCPTGIQLDIVASPPEDVKELLASTVYGMKGKMQYRHRNSNERIQQLVNSRFITLRKAGKLLGTIGILYRTTNGRRKKASTFYFRYFSIPFMRRMRSGTINTGKGTPLLRGTIKARIGEMLNGKLCQEVNQDANTPHAYFGIVEKENDLSRALCEMYGFEKIRNVKTFVFSRISPAGDARAQRAGEQHKQEILSRLDREYSDHSFYFTDTVFSGTDYFIWQEEGRMVAGIKTTRAEWEICHIPGFTGFVMRHLLPHIPYLSRLFRPREMNFAAFEAAWCDDGKTEQLIALMDSVCASLKVHMGILWADAESKLAERLSGCGQLGILNKLKDDVPAEVYAKFENFAQEEKQAFYQHPVYVSAQDMV